MEKVREAIGALWGSLPSWAKWIVFALALSAASSFLTGTFYYYPAGKSVGYKIGYEDGRAHAPKKTDIPDELTN